MQGNIKEVSEEMGKINSIIKEISPYYAKNDVLEEHALIYDSMSETLEPTYFWILDFMENFFKSDIQKLVDNFVSTPGSGHFGELGTRATRMQEEAMKILGNVNTVVKSILNLIYSLKEFEIRLEHYKAAESKEKEKEESGILALKQIWIDNVDVKRGNSSVKAMALGQPAFVTLLDAFMAVKNLKGVDKLDLNDRVKRILKQRVKEFYDWKERSEQELKKRFKIERSYLKSQVNALKLYTSWLRPYVRAAEDLKMTEGGRYPALVKAFNTIVLQLTLLGKSDVNIEGAVTAKELPPKFDRIKFKRKYYSCVTIEFLFRGLPSRIAQQSHYAFGGRAEVRFKAYALNDDELFMLDKKLREESIEDGLTLLEGITTDSLDEIKEDIDHFLKGEDDEEEKKKKEGDVNPFSALFGAYSKNKVKKDVKQEITKVKKDSYEESLLRALAESTARDFCYKIFDVYKKAHGMASLPIPPNTSVEPEKTSWDKLLEI